MLLLTIPSYRDLCSGSRELKDKIDPSFSPINVSDSFLDYLRRILDGKLPKEIFWNVYIKIISYNSFHIVSEVYVLAFFGNGQICFI